MLTALSDIFGLGKYQSLQICNALGISSQLYIKQLNPVELEQLTQLITQNYEIGLDVKRIVNKNIRRLITISSYKGFRHAQSLPVRGQRTHGNAKTSRKRQSHFLTKNA